jgi:Transposase DDE domain
LSWFNGAVQEVFLSYGFFDPEGVLIGDGSYLFVPDNPAYEGSVVMWFDEHNHPVDYDKLDAEARKKAVRRRCYKWVSLLHRRGESYVYAAAVVVPGNKHENTVLWDLVDQLVKRVGRGVFKWLILDRGFIDGEAIRRCKTEHNLDVLIPIKRNMDLWTDAWALAGQAKWELLPEPAKAAPRPAPQRPEAMVRREAKRQKTLAEQRAQEPTPPPKPRQEACAIEGFTSWTSATVPLEVILMRDQGVDDPDSHWGLLTTATGVTPVRGVGLYRYRTGIEERHRQLKCFHDLTDFRSRSFNAVVAQVVFILLAYTLRQWQLWTLKKTVWAGLSPEQLEQRMAIHTQWVVIYHDMSYVQLPLATFTREVLELEGEARQKALIKVRELEQRLMSPVAPLRPRPP